MLVQSASPYRPAGTLDPSTALLPYRGPWNARKAAHLLRRAGFGGSASELAAFAALSMDGAVDRLIHFPNAGGLPPAPELADDRPNRALMRAFANANAQGPQPQNQIVRTFAAPPRPDPLGLSNQMMAEAPMPGATPAAQPAEANPAIKQFVKNHVANSVALMQWWLGRMIATPAPLQEKMTLFWHGHFTTAYQGKGITAQDVLRQNQLYRSFALGNIRQLTLAVSQDPAMLKYLDNRASRAEHPNENYARELMELFTLGIGNYTEQDVRESARAFTGWTIGPGDEFVFNRRFHDEGVKTFLGRTGNFTGSDIVDIIFQQPAAPKWFATKLLEFFVYSDPEPALVDGVAALLKKNNFELAPVMSTLLRSEVFHSERAYRALVKSPTEFIVGTYKLFGLSEIAPPVLGAMNRMGQRLFYPPNVKGWDGGEAWLNSATLLSRENFASAVCQNPDMMRNATWLTQN
ncbi:MAG: DUF1800 family protein, partial [Candidatus Eremiobacteraeota bacterium]|nr:DUF1800 family protein [Candidatus Eremiobacteraeota bacterium]